MKMPEVWFRMAEMIFNRETYFLCLAVQSLRRSGQITTSQYREVMRAIDAEMYRQGLQMCHEYSGGGRPPLWRCDDPARIRFCTCQIRSFSHA